MKRCEECRGWLVPVRDPAVRLWRCEECPAFLTDELYLTLPEAPEGPTRATPNIGPAEQHRYIPVRGPRGEGFPAALVNCPECTGTLQWLNHAKLWRCDQCAHQETDQRNIERTTQAKEADERRKQPILEWLTNAPKYKANLTYYTNLKG